MTREHLETLVRIVESMDCAPRLKCAFLAGMICGIKDGDIQDFLREETWDDSEVLALAETIDEVFGGDTITLTAAILQRFGCGTPR